MNPFDEKSREVLYKANPLDADDSRWRRNKVTVELRKSKKEDQITRRRNINEEDLDLPHGELPKDQPVQSPQWSLEEIVIAMKSEDEERQLLGMQQVRKILSRNLVPPVDLIIGYGIVPICIRYLANPSSSTDLKFEASWALTNMAAGTSVQTRYIIDQGAVPHFVALMKSKSMKLLNQVVWALCNIVGDGTAARDIVFQNKIVDAILPLINETPITIAVCRNVVWLMSNLCDSKNLAPPPFKKIKRLVPVLSDMLIVQDIEVQTEACWALSYVTDDESNDQIQAVVNADAVPRLVKLLQSDESPILLPALRTIGNIVTGTDDQTEMVIAAGGLPKLAMLLDHPKSNIVKEAAWAVSNITAGSQQQLQAVIDAGIFQQIEKVLEKGEFLAQQEAVWSVTNIIAVGTPEQIINLINETQILKPFINLVDCQDPRTILVVLTGLTRLFAISAKMGCAENLFETVEVLGGVTKLEKLLNHENKEINKKAFDILDTYYEAEQILEEPQESNGSLDFNGNMSKAPDGGYSF